MYIIIHSVGLLLVLAAVLTLSKSQIYHKFIVLFHSHLITIGRQDRAIIVWKVLPPYSKKTGRVVAAPSVGSNDR
jgi:hypothetical protein